MAWAVGALMFSYNCFIAFWALMAIKLYLDIHIENVTFLVFYVRTNITRYFLPDFSFDWSQFQCLSTKLSNDDPLMDTEASFRLDSHLHMPGVIFGFWRIVIFDPIDFPYSPLPKWRMIETKKTVPKVLVRMIFPADIALWVEVDSEGLKCNFKPSVQQLGGRPWCLW